MHNRHLRPPLTDGSEQRGGSANCIKQRPGLVMGEELNPVFLMSHSFSFLPFLFLLLSRSHHLILHKITECLLYSKYAEYVACFM